MNIQDIRKALFQIEELAGKSQRIWDNSWTNAVVADHPDKDGYTQKTYEATRIHAECMELLRSLADRLQSDAEQQAEFTTIERIGRTFTSEAEIWPN